MSESTRAKLPPDGDRDEAVANEITSAFEFECEGAVLVGDGKCVEFWKLGHRSAPKPRWGGQLCVSISWLVRTGVRVFV